MLKCPDTRSQCVQMYLYFYFKLAPKMPCKLKMHPYSFVFLLSGFDSMGYILRYFETKPHSPKLTLTPNYKHKDTYPT
jgi:hypothetical protein